jgi:hypothetical protein
MKALEAKVTVAAWRTKPSWYVVATEDGAIAPELLRSTAGRIGAKTTDVAGSHVVFLTQPKAVADVIAAAAWVWATETRRWGPTSTTAVELMPLPTSFRAFRPRTPISLRSYAMQLGAFDSPPP